MELISWTIVVYTLKLRCPTVVFPQKDICLEGLVWTWVTCTASRMCTRPLTVWQYVYSKRHRLYVCLTLSNLSPRGAYEYGRALPSSDCRGNLWFFPPSLDLPRSSSRKQLSPIIKPFLRPAQKSWLYYWCEKGRNAICLKECSHVARPTRLGNSRKSYSIKKQGIFSRLFLWWCTFMCLLASLYRHLWSWWCKLADSTKTHVNWMPL